MARGEVLRIEPPKIGVVYDDPLDDTATASLYFNTVVGQMAAWFHECRIGGYSAGVAGWHSPLHASIRMEAFLQ